MTWVISLKGLEWPECYFWGKSNNTGGGYICTLLLLHSWVVCRSLFFCSCPSRLTFFLRSSPHPPLAILSSPARSPHLVWSPLGFSIPFSPPDLIGLFKAGILQLEFPSRGVYPASCIHVKTIVTEIEVSASPFLAGFPFPPLFVSHRCANHLCHAKAIFTGFCLSYVSAIMSVGDIISSLLPQSTYLFCLKPYSFKNQTLLRKKMTIVFVRVWIQVLQRASPSLSVLETAITPPLILLCKAVPIVS